MKGVISYTVVIACFGLGVLAAYLLATPVVHAMLAAAHEPESDGVQIAGTVVKFDEASSTLVIRMDGPYDDLPQNLSITLASSTIFKEYDEQNRATAFNLGDITAGTHVFVKIVRGEGPLRAGGVFVHNYL